MPFYNLHWNFSIVSILFLLAWPPAGLSSAYVLYGVQYRSRQQIEQVKLCMNCSFPPFRSRVKGGNVILTLSVAWLILKASYRLNIDRDLIVKSAKYTDIKKRMKIQSCIVLTWHWAQIQFYKIKKWYRNNEVYLQIIEFTYRIEAIGINSFVALCAPNSASLD